ncbi:TniQ family protein [Rhizobium ruizarguesonis]|uniref:TniQ family protein n=1 Tax=Rhizobium TaxID=379 RepID=UPI0013EEE17C|nr:TniQ family protein [Rhizobium ruizarguesonis]
MTGLFRVPLFETESFLSFLCRMSRVNGRDSVRGFLSDFALSSRDIINGDHKELERLGVLFDMDPSLLHSRAIKPMDGQRYLFNGEIYNRPALSHSRFRVCACCLREDDSDRDRKPGTRRYARSIWSIRSVHACIKHSRRLTSINTERSRVPDFYRFMDAASDAISGSENAENLLHATDFERFVAERLSGVRGHGVVLDAMPLPQSIDLCQIFGLAVQLGREFKIPDVNETEMRNAMALGFHSLRGGKPSIFEALSRIQSERAKSTTRGGRALYGHLYYLLSEQTRGDEYDIFRKIVHEHATATAVMLPDSRVFELVGEKGSASLKTVVLGTGLTRNTVRRYLNEYSVRSTNSKLDANGFVDAETAAHAIEILGDSMSLPAASQLLGWQVTDFRRLVDLGIVRPVLSRVTKGKGLKPRYSRQSVLELKSGLSSRVVTASTGLITIRLLGSRISSGHDDVLRAVFDGRLRTIDLLDAGSMRDAVLVDLWEVLHKVEGVFLGPRTVTKILGFEEGTLPALERFQVFTGRFDGPWSISASDVAAFNQKYITSARFKRESEMGRYDFEKRVSLLGIEAAFPTDQIGQMILHRKDAALLMTCDPESVTSIPTRR